MRYQVLNAGELMLLALAILFFIQYAFALPSVTYIFPTLSENAITNMNWTYINITSDENLTQSLLEWGNASGFANISMTNFSASMMNWYVNMTNLTDRTYNYTIWMQNTTGNWSQSSRKWVAVDTVAPYNLFACQNLTIENGSYVLVQNVSSEGTCFAINANNITLDGAGYTINYSQLGTGSAIIAFGSSYLTIRNLNIVQENSSIQYAHAIRVESIENSTMVNNTISTFGSTSYGVFLVSSNSSNISSNNITTAGSSSYGVFLTSSKLNMLSGNIIKGTGSAPGVYLFASNSNNISSGSIISNQSFDYYLSDAGTTNNFTNTNFTTQRKIYFYDTTSWFNYNNETNGNIWLATSVSAQSSINRTLTNWSRANFKWNDTNSTAGIIAAYNITGLWSNVNYSIYNTSFGIQTNPYNLTADATGNLPGINIALNGNTEIAILKTENAAPEIALTSPADMEWSASRTISHQFIPSDDAGFGNCSAWSNSTGAWSLMQVNTSAVINGGTNTISSAYTQDGDFKWGIRCYDNGNPQLSSFSMTNRTVRIDSAPPNITLLSPANTSTWTSSPAVLFEFRASDAVDILNCSLLVNGAVSENDTTIARDTTQNFTKTLSNGNYNWSISCYDSLNNVGGSGANNLFVNYTAPPTCSDGMQNGGETGVDCGGSCSACEDDEGGGGGSSNVTSLTVRPSGPITKITVKFKTSILSPSINVSRVTIVSVDTPSGKVYQYYSITKSNFEDADIDSATIDFKVNTSWITSERISKINMERYTNGWGKLQTDYVNSSGGYDTYVAHTDGFSYFAIVGESDEPPPSSGPGPVPSMPDVPNINTGTNISGQNIDMGIKAEDGIGFGTILFVLIIIVVIGGIYIYSVYRKGESGMPAEVPQNTLKSQFSNLANSVSSFFAPKNNASDAETKYLVTRLKGLRDKGTDTEYLVNRLKEAKKSMEGINI